LIVIARLVRATHDLGDEGMNAAAPSDVPLADTEILGGPDKPGHDDI